ncbi:MAG TPA: translation initiation factor IF-3 [Gammaproteobacteria bacterium]|nr:translation initiation factor IF-3 [Gammaproteobacteria bacterium]
MNSKNRALINDEITSSQIRLIDHEGEQVGVVSIEKGLELAKSVGMDLVEIAPNSEPPVCKIMDHGKYLFEKSKKRQQSRKKQKQVQVKEMKFRPATEEGDYQVKLRNLKRFLNDGDRAKVTMRFRGREIAHQDLGIKVLERIEEDLAEISIVEQQPKKEGRQLVMVLAPKK